MKVGKSTLIGALAVAVAQGRPFLGYPTKQTGVLILALEEHPRDLQRRLQAFGLRPEDPLWVQCDPVRLSPETLRELEVFVGAHGIGLVIIDTLGRLWRVEDENDNAEIERALGPVLGLARRTGACVLLVHHERKGTDEQRQTGETIRGGSALLGLVDQALLLRRGEAPNERVLVTVGRYAETPRRLQLRLVGDDY
jgi:RecA-family ATPase